MEDGEGSIRAAADKGLGGGDCKAATPGVDEEENLLCEECGSDSLQCSVAAEPQGWRGGPWFGTLVRDDMSWSAWYDS